MLVLRIGDDHRDFVKLSDRIQQTFILFLSIQITSGARKQKRRMLILPPIRYPPLMGRVVASKSTALILPPIRLSAIDPILDKIGKHGMDSLSKHEKALLEQARKETKRTMTAINLKVNVGRLTLKNPILTASGTFGYGKEYADLLPIDQLGGITVKGVSTLCLPWQSGHLERQSFLAD